MTLKSFKEEISKANAYLDSNQVADAFLILENIATEEGNHYVLDNLKQMMQTYGYMIHYLIEGVDDVSRQDVYEQIMNSLRNTVDDLLFDKLSSDSTDIYFSTARICRHRGSSFPVLWANLIETEAKLRLAESVGADSVSIRSDKYSLMQQIFDLVWTERNNKVMCQELVIRVSDSSVDKDLSAYIVASVVLSLLEYYDSSKMTALIDIYEGTESEELAARSLVGIVLALYRHKKRVLDDKKVVARLGLWQDSLLTYSRLRCVVKEIIRTRDTDRVAAKMRDEVIPELMKLSPDMLKMMRESAMDFESGMLENNPEWEEMLEKNGLADKLRDLTEMQSEGADLMMVTFSNLKGFPFFNSVNSWFLPFDVNNPEIKMGYDVIKPIETMFSIGSNMCDSDKYSLVFALASMPEFQRKMMIGQFEQQLSQVVEEAGERIEKRSHPEFTLAATVFIRELYRFFKLFRKKHEFYDPFVNPFNFLDLPVIGCMVADEDTIALIGEFYFRRGYNEEALSLFKALEETKGKDPSYWEKIGYAFQSLKHYDEALVAYRKSELLGEPGQWLLKKLAFVNKKLGNYDDAAGYYLKALENDPDNVSLIMNAGYSLFETGEIDAALRSYYHANYLNPENINILRAIAWAELINGNFDKSTGYYDKILKCRPVAIDYLNAGHAKLASNNIKEAVELYRNSSKDSFDEFESAFKSDSNTLTKLGIDDLTQHLILDYIKMSDKAKL